MKYYHILRERMSRDEAAAIFRQYGADPDSADLRGQWKQLVKQHHPDKGGDTVTAAKINAAYDVLKAPPQAEPTSGGWGGTDWQQDGEWYEERPRRQRNWYYDPGENARHERAKEESGDERWSWAGYSGGMHHRPTIHRHDYTDVNYIKKRIWELSGKSTEEWTIWGFDGAYLRNVTTVYGSPKIFAQMAEAMIQWQTSGGNPYDIRAVLVERDKPHVSKPWIDEEDHAGTVYIIWADGVFYDKDPIPVKYETFNANPGNDRSFNHRLRRMLDDMQAQGGRRHEQPEMDMKGYDRQTETFETGSYVVHPKYGLGRIVNPEVRKGMARVAFADRTGNVKITSLRAATGAERARF